MFIDMRARSAYGAVKFFEDNPQAFWALVAMAIIGAGLMLVLRFVRPAYVNRLEGSPSAPFGGRYYPAFARRSDADSPSTAVWKAAQANQRRIPGYALTKQELTAGSVDLLRRAVLSRDYSDIADIAAELGDDDLAGLIRQGTAGRAEGAERRYRTLVDGWLEQSYSFAPEPRARSSV